MITETGKAILSKYLIGQSPGYASHIALGCGPRPLGASTPFGDYSNKESLDFEMFRVPIISRGYVTENNQTSIALTAELPTEERYEITEVGIYSAGANPSAGSRDSKTVFSFSRNEGWEYHADGAAQSLPVRNLPLNTQNSDDIDFLTLTEQYRYYVLEGGLAPNSFSVSRGLFKINNNDPQNPISEINDIAVSTLGETHTEDAGAHKVLNANGELIGVVTIATLAVDEPNEPAAVITVLSPEGIPAPHGLSAQDPVYFVSSGILPSSILSARPVIPALQTGASNVLFNKQNRIDRNERSRFLDNIVLIAGDTANILKDEVTGLLSEGVGSKHIHLTGQSFSFDQNSSTDELRLAFSVVNRLEQAADPAEVRVIVEFRSTEGAEEGFQFARFSTSVLRESEVGGALRDRYFIASKKLEELEKSANFAWSSMTLAKISVSVLDDEMVSSDKWYVALDALRFENTSIKNPLYGLTGYSVVRSKDGLPIVKGSNTKSLVEFRFDLSVGS
jgi:hypothetical protein